ncbi:hypothetical protein CDAR_300091 [Caerostris darwini]|uniref:Secreted protein n=1 Tax=Caerostris darwini TaxID=1538125 RepID=A0AAV4W3B1_9ARAC|nr:hypothetical protein CDAR_300091 [Caerostris darwini]
MLKRTNLSVVFLLLIHRFPKWTTATWSEFGQCSALRYSLSTTQEHNIRRVTSVFASEAVDLGLQPTVVEGWIAAMNPPPCVPRVCP